MINFLVSCALALYLLAPMPVLAENLVKGPLSYSLKEYGLVLLLALAGGLASWWAKVRRGELVMWSLSSLIGELCMSAFAGLMSFYACEWLQINPLLTACVVGMSGHAGARALSWAETLGQRYVEKRLGIQPESKQ